MLKLVAVAVSKNKIQSKGIMKIENKQNNHKSKNIRWKWCIKIFLITLMLSFSLSVLSELLLEGTRSWVVTLLSIALLIFFILLAVFCDMIGVAMTSADISPFMAMASKKIKGAKETIKLLKNADRASSFFCDIIGDACGIICGAIGASIIGVVLTTGDIQKVMLSALMSALIAALTVFGKAVGKNIAVQNANRIVFRVGKIISFFKRSK